MTTQPCWVCGTVLDASGDQPLSRVTCPKCGQKTLVQRNFDHFVPVETLGVGGMGTVYKARDARLDRYVALKLLRRDLGGEEDQDARLQEEARIAASVNHPNVVQIFSLGMDHGQFYVVMELIDHGSLDDLMESQGRLPEHQVLDVGIQIARGLRAAHRKGLIHRDVKPANILFVDEQATKIGDFGLAAFATQRPQPAETDNVIWGTPAYVAPERLYNQPEDVRSDIYSLGATLFHAVAGKPPIETSTSSATELRELKQHPSDLRAIAPEVSAPTARVLQQMIAPDPAQRFATYDDLLAHLDAARRALEFEIEREARRSSRWSLNRLFPSG
jgi:serine/threonine protein kinase